MAKHARGHNIGAGRSSEPTGKRSGTLRINSMVTVPRGVVKRTPKKPAARTTYDS